MKANAKKCKSHVIFALTINVVGQPTGLKLGHY